MNYINNLIYSLLIDIDILFFPASNNFLKLNAGKAIGAFVLVIYTFILIIRRLVYD